MRQELINRPEEADSRASDRDAPLVLAVIGAGRAGGALARAARAAGVDVRLAGRERHRGRGCRRLGGAALRPGRGDRIRVCRGRGGGAAGVRRPCQRRHPTSRARLRGRARSGDLLPTSAADDPRSRDRPDRVPLRRQRLERARARVRRRPCAAPRPAPVPARGRATCRLPRRRQHRLELPRRARGVRRRTPRPGRGRRRPRGPRPAGPAHGGELGRARVRGAHRPDRPRRRGDRGRATSRRSRSTHPS